MEDLEQALRRLRTLHERWKADFRCAWDKSVIQGSDGGKKVGFVKECKEVFDWATDILDKSWNTDPSEKNQYIDLVSAHCIMSYHVIAKAAEMQDTETRWKEEYRNSERERHHKQRFGKGVYLDWSYRVAEFYVRDVVQEQGGYVLRHLRSKGCDIPQQEIEMAWWIMIVKGIAWDLSTTGGPWRRNKKQESFRWTADYVPSKYFNMWTPVWIT